MSRNKKPSGQCTGFKTLRQSFERIDRWIPRILPVRIFPHVTFFFIKFTCGVDSIIIRSSTSNQDFFHNLQRESETKQKFHIKLFAWFKILAETMGSRTVTLAKSSSVWIIIRAKWFRSNFVTDQIIWMRIWVRKTNDRIWKISQMFN